MAVVVTGAAGFIGSHLVEALDAKGAEVVAIDRVPLPPLSGGRSIHADLLSDSPEVAEALSTATQVFHLAGAPGVRKFGTDAEAQRRRDNVMATARVLSLVPIETTIVVTSSSSVYGGTLAGRASYEDDELRPRGGYAESKVAMERLCRERIAAGGVVTIARPFSVAGERQRPDMALATWIDAVAANRPVRLIGSPDRGRDITDIRDVVECLSRLGEISYPGAVNIGSGVTHTLRQMLDAVCFTVGATPAIEQIPAGCEEPTLTLADTDRLAGLTGIRPRTDLMALIRRQADAQLGGEVRVAMTDVPVLTIGERQR